LRILFLVGGRKFDVRPWMALTAELIARGHQPHFAFKELPATEKLRRAHGAGFPAEVTYGVAPGRSRLDGWRSVAMAVRLLGDLARYSHPRYEQAPILRERMAARVLDYLRKPYQLEPIGRALGLRYARRLVSTSDAVASARAIRTLARLEQTIPSSSRVDRYLEAEAPDVVLATGVVGKPSQVDFLKSARKLGIPTGICVASWDNLTNKGLLKICPDRVFVWNETQRREATELHGIPAERVVATGAQLFDEWFDRTPSTGRTEFVEKIGLAAGPYVLYLGSSSFITARGGEVELVLEWIRALRSSSDDRLRGLGVVIRPHPGAPRRWEHAGLESLENVVVWPPRGVMPISHDARDDFFDTIAHSAAVVGLNTTAMIEAAVIGKSVLTIVAREFAQEDTLHFHYLLEENGGFLHVASSLEEHLGQLAHVVDEEPADAERRLRFVEQFVRPHGLERPATPIFADAVEELASSDVQPPTRPAPGLRALLAVEAGLCAAALVAGRFRRRASALLPERRSRGESARGATQTVQP
jgi:hypothetical protein